MVRRWLGLGAPLLATVGFVAALTAQGCTVVVSDGPVDDGGIFEGDATPGPNGTACNECLFQQCSGNWAVCQNQSECFAIYTCALACNGSQTCINGCFCGHPTGQNAYVALAACDSFYSCNASCNTQCTPAAASCTSPGVIARDVCGAAPPDSGTGDTDSGVASDADTDTGVVEIDAALPPTDAAVVQDCTGCISGKCSAEKDACAPNSECEGYTLCLAACNDATCISGCETAHPTGKTASQALESCTVANCKDACGL
jgi:hypothetical protein